MRFIKEIFKAPLDIYNSKNLIFSLAVYDFKNKYLGTYLGIIWALLSPLITILVFMFVFMVGFKAAPVSNIPFALWLTTGIIPWFFFSDAFAGATTSISFYDFLVKKIVFRVSFLPLIKIISAFFIHVCFAVILFVVLTYFKIYPSLIWFQYFYYLIAVIILLIGASWVTASLAVFAKDVDNIIMICLQFGFWLTPIFWNINQVPQKYQFILKLNPVFYIVQGFRDTFLFDIWFWQRPVITLYFWFFVVFMFFIGLWVFKKMRPHFADVL